MIRLSSSASIYLALALAFAVPGRQALADAEQPAVQARKSLQMEDFLGVNVMFTLYDREDYDKQISALQRLGIKWVRLGLHWYLIEPRPGQRDYARLDAVMDAIKAAGLKSVVSVAAPPAHQSSGAGKARPDQYPPANDEVYGDLLVALAKRYPQVNAWQIWNEPNLRMFWQPDDQPEAYHALVESTAAKMRKAVPDRTLVLAGMAYWSIMFKRNALMFEDLGKLHTFNRVDAVAYHPYLKTPYGDADSQKPYDFITTGQWLNAALTQWGARQIWATEWGWGSYKIHKLHDELVSEQEQARNMLQRLVLMMAMGYDKVFYFGIADLPDDVPLPYRDSGLIDRNANPKPSYRALARFLELANGRLDPIPAPAMDGNPPRLWQFNWKTGNGQKLWIAWADSPIKVKLANITGTVRIHDLLPGTVTSVSADKGGVEIPVNAAPLIAELP